MFLFLSFLQFLDVPIHLYEKKCHSMSRRRRRWWWWWWHYGRKALCKLLLLINWLGPSLFRSAMHPRISIHGQHSNIDNFKVIIITSRFLPVTWSVTCVSRLVGLLLKAKRMVHSAKNLVLIIGSKKSS